MWHPPDSCKGETLTSVCGDASARYPGSGKHRHAGVAISLKRAGRHPQFTEISGLASDVGTNPFAAITAIFAEVLGCVDAPAIPRCLLIHRVSLAIGARSAMRPASADALNRRIAEIEESRRGPAIPRTSQRSVEQRKGSCRAAL